MGTTLVLVLVLLWPRVVTCIGDGRIPRTLACHGTEWLSRVLSGIENTTISVYSIRL